MCICDILPRLTSMILYIIRTSWAWRCHKTKWAASWQNQQCGCAPSEDSDQPGHPPSLIRVFAVRLKKPWVLSYPLSAQRRLWSDWANAQADLSSLGAHSLCWFCHVAAQIFLEKCGVVKFCNQFNHNVVRFRPVVSNTYTNSTSNHCLVSISGSVCLQLV